MSVEAGMTLSNITSNLETRSKVVVTKTKTLLEIRQGNMTFTKNSGRQPTTWNSVEDWKKWLQSMKFPDKIEKLHTSKRLTTPLGVPVITPSVKLTVGEVLSSEDGKSKVVVLKTGELLEVRRGDVTFTKRVKKTVTPKTWKTVEEWNASLDEPESKRQKLNEYVESPYTMVKVKPYVEIHPRPFPTFESKYIWEERVRSKMTSELKKDMDEFVTEWVKKFKFE